MAIVLEHGTEFIIYLLLNLLGRYYYYLARPAPPVPLVRVGLVILLEPHILVEAAERLREFEGVADARGLRVRELVFEGRCDEVVLQLVDREQALETRVHVAVVRIVLQPY